MTRKKCRKLIMSSGAQKREVDEYMDNLLPELGSYERVFVSTVIYALVEALGEAYVDVQTECGVRCRT